MNGLAPPEFSLKDRHGIGWRLLQYLQANPWSDQRKIAGGTGVSVSSVNRYLGKGAALGDAVEMSGSRPARFALTSKYGRLVAIDMGAQHWRLAVENLRPDLEKFTPDVVHVDVLANPKAALRQISSALTRRMREGEIRPKDVAGVVVGVPVPLHDDDSVRGDITWKRFDPYRSFKRELAWARHVKIETDGGLGAFAELQAVRAVERTNPDRATIAYVKWSSKLTAAMIVGGTIHRGDGLAASFLHSPVDDDAIPECDVCGRPCTAQFTSLNEVFRRVRALRGGKSTRLRGEGTEEQAAALYELALDDQRVEAIVLDAAQALGRSIADAANVMGTSHVVIGGAFKEEAAEWTQAAVWEGFKQRATPSVEVQTKVWDGSYTGRAAITGGLALCADQFAVPLLYSKYVLHHS